MANKVKENLKGRNEIRKEAENFLKVFGVKVNRVPWKVPVRVLELASIQIPKWIALVVTESPENEYAWNIHYCEFIDMDIDLERWDVLVI